MTKSPGPLRAEGGFPVVGIIGGGQLARMSQQPAIALSLTLSVLAESPTAAAALVVPHAPVGDHTDVETVRAFAQDVDVVTFDHEHVPPQVISALLADGRQVHPGPEALLHAQDKIVMRRRLTELGIPCPRWTAATSAQDVTAFGEEIGWPVIAKTPRGGYDGKGVRRISSAAEVADWLEVVGQEGPMREGVLLEESVDFTRELAAMVARSPSGQAATWPVVETVQTNSICTEVIAPAPGLDPDLASRIGEAALRIAGALGVTGVMAVELFEVRDAQTGAPAYLVNELAMRPHNSGHWSIDGAVTSQFEQHLRAVLDLPLGDPSARQRWAVMANVLGGEHPDLYPTYRHLMARDPGLKVHLYGKGVRPGRKLGHVTVTGDGDLEELRARARHAADYLQGVIDE
ncbi:5-(carboxyamino)imidazole ribonucleotide synthase [Ornithinimicrobium cryptoxanthini]|uniref:N5-carboxyaminoimidazole ribonucleotide synthase n=1 Tax=Ornithinimicrobium cryptoxanthini TaxID=2934161 RepID=A0ABY4YM79_9MICO|nr:5-(carboxyamino)imidazole ribonucleotide synthase [Ornithinimicrobium cryptoxanthini]USQ77262.1 5-(carboxyamino)imidazole ribonucleotide synthase [Ornithinimicrobium cryptoxanthini]